MSAKTVLKAVIGTPLAITWPKPLPEQQTALLEALSKLTVDERRAVTVGCNAVLRIIHSHTPGYTVIVDRAAHASIVEPVALSCASTDTPLVPVHSHDKPGLLAAAMGLRTASAIAVKLEETPSLSAAMDGVPHTVQAPWMKSTGYISYRATVEKCVQASGKARKAEKKKGGKKKGKRVA
ncbi:hypothetical protein J8273_8007 [Carpediemonas membranifera]|uniref:Uncharacterized protein n=1 Tax=Carpediemonas membranifera TaxID=201153 RepID=A0A8J6B5U8_9EUKA|nr:hypothetical protein J8273_8007 [Carpediemonas membranifera]|eukprot:KAG9390642.1 hypothetical protein J8273_8007 [Carpediemonas membranifera]